MKRLQRIALFFFFFSINFEMWDPFSTNGYFSLSKLVGLFYLLVMIPTILNFRTPDKFKPILRPIWFFFLILTVVSLLHIQTDNLKFIDFTILQNIVLFWILINHEHNDNLVLERSLLGFAAGSIALAVLFNLDIGLDFDPVSNRYSIFGDNANNIGIRMSISLIIIPLTIMQNKLNHGKARFLLFIGVPFIFNAMIATGSRVSFIAFLLSYIFYIVLYESKSRWSKVILVMFGVLILIYIWQVLLRSEEITQRLIQSFREGDLSERDVVWKGVLPIWAKNPIFGVGKTGYEYITFNAFGREVSPHNVLLEVLCLTGIAGLIFYLIFLYRIVHISFQTRKYNKFLLSILLLIPVLGLLLSAQLLQVKIGWIIFAYVAANSIYITKDEAVPINPDA
jgi:O-antigen ligase